ncbi:hypothetical protein [Psychrobacillus sp.]|uniref:hypothetical protein n=1 Tax=Psychrobacillus sp. TaxID=1871623 RepID=UPI0028BDDF4B|nr:hypothetical protein [Psychrobacillus sp.]
MPNYLLRKLVTTVITTVITSVSFVAYSLIRNSTGIDHSLGSQFLGWFMVWFIYSGAVIFIYGSLVSIGIDFIQRKGFIRPKWLYVLIHGLFGIMFGVFAQEWLLSIYGMLIASMYAIIYKLLSKILLEKKSIKMFFLIPSAFLLLSWGYFYVISAPIPLFTEEDAVEFATSGNGTVTSDFPKKVGKWQGSIDGFEVERATDVKQIAKEKYIVTFTEKWEKGYITGTCFYSYIVERNSSTANELCKKTPPYYKQ